MLPNLSVNSCIETTVKYSIPTADVCFVARQPETIAPVCMEVGTPPSSFILAEVISLLIKLCGLPSDASFSNPFPAWVNKQLIHLLPPSYRLVAITLNTRLSR